MLTSILNLLPKISVAMATLPEFVRLIDEIIETLDEEDQTVLKNAYAEAIAASDDANAELVEAIANSD